jgi:predicted DNA-binding protein
MKKVRIQTSVRLTTEAKEMVEKISEKLGITKNGVVEMSIRRLAELENIKSD